jgi:hypothetical protein
VACLLGPRGNPPHGPLERGRAPHSWGALAGQPRMHEMDGVVTGGNTGS